MKNGFTLVEMLAVMLLLGLLILIFVPNTIKLVKENSLKVYKIKEKEMIKAAEEYSNYDDNFVEPSTDPTYITITKLVNGNYMNKILDSTSSNECTGYVKVTLNPVNGYNYSPCLICDEYTSSTCSAVNINEITWSSK